MQLTITGPEDRLAELLESISDATFFFRRNDDQVAIHAHIGKTSINVVEPEDELNELVVDDETEAEPEADELDAPETDDEAVEAPAGTLPNNIVRHLNAHGPATTTDIANALGAESGDTLAMLRRLRELGKVESAGRSGWKIAARRGFDPDAARRRAGQGF